MKPTFLYIHGLYSDQYSRKFLNLKNYFKDELEYNFIEWNKDSDINLLINEKILELNDVEELIIFGDSTGANFACQFRDLRNSEKDILILTSPLLDLEKLNSDFDLPEKLIQYLKKYSAPENALIIASLKDKVLNHRYLVSEKRPKNLQVSLVSDNHRLLNFEKYLQEIRRYIFADLSVKSFIINDLPTIEIAKLVKLNNDIRNLELKIRETYFKIKNHKNQLLKQNLIDDFELDIEVQLYSDDFSTQKQFGVSEDDSFYTSHFVSSSYLEDEEMFNMNWSEGADNEYEICYILHDLMYHSTLSLETILTTNKIWLDFNVQYQFSIDVDF